MVLMHCQYVNIVIICKCNDFEEEGKIFALHFEFEFNTLQYTTIHNTLQVWIQYDTKFKSQSDKRAILKCINSYLDVTFIQN